MDYKKRISDLIPGVLPHCVMQGQPGEGVLIIFVHHTPILNPNAMLAFYVFIILIHTLAFL